MDINRGEKMEDSINIIEKKVTKEEIIASVKQFIIDNFMFGNESEMVANEDSFMENGIIDSTGILELIDFSEETYGISIKDNELIPENLDSLDNISGFILLKKAEGK
jgi:acyl carrier protein